MTKAPSITGQQIAPTTTPDNSHYVTETSNGLNSASASDNSSQQQNKTKFIKWSDYKTRQRRWAAFAMMDRLGAKLMVVLIGNKTRCGLVHSLNTYNEANRCHIRINMATEHLVELELVSC